MQTKLLQLKCFFKMSICRLNTNSYDVSTFRFQHYYNTAYSVFLLGASIFRRNFKKPSVENRFTKKSHKQMFVLYFKKHLIWWIRSWSGTNSAIIDATHYLILNPYCTCNLIKLEIVFFYPSMYYLNTSTYTHA